jgi:hypothetical protein
MENATAAVEQPPHPVLSIPPYLLDWPTWAAWTAPRKNPLDLRRHLAPADVTRPDTWASFSHARTYLERASRLAPPALPLDCGVGILVAPPLVFVDLDDIQPEAESPATPWAAEFLQRAADIGAFTEWSGSGTGAHAFIRVSSAFPTLTRNRYTRSGAAGPIGIEVYSGARFAALSGFPYFPWSRPTLNEPRDGDNLLTAFIAELGVKGAPILSQPLGPIAVPTPTQKVLEVARRLAEFHILSRAFDNPEAEFVKWAEERHKRSLDNSLSAWRFYLYSVASRESPISPLPIYELFCPQKEPQHAGIPNWQEVSGYLRKKHRRYSDIQRAHALVVEEQRLLALDLGEPPPPTPSRTAAPRHPVNTDLADSWAQLGLAMKVTKNSAVPVVGSVNFIRVIEKHSHFQQYKLERNALDGTTRCNRVPMPDTLPTRFLEPLRAILDMSGDPPIDAVRGAIEVVAENNAYDPLVEYLRGLPKYSPASDPSYLSTWLERIGAAPSPDLERYSRRIMLGLVARALKPGCKFDYVPVFEGPQGIGKSTLVEKLVTTEFYAVLSYSLDKPDARNLLRGKWAVEMGEMAAFKRSDEEARKQFFSTAADDFRPPYGRAFIKVLRRVVLFGTTNDKQYLSDHTGARRYWPISFPGEINIRWFVENRDALFAEALHYFEAGEVYHDTTEEMQEPERLKSLEERLITPAWHQRILDHLKNLPVPHLPEGERPGHPGVVTTQYIANLQRILDLPPAVNHMSDAQLATFLRRSGYAPKTLAYRHEGRSCKTYGWAHPAFRHLTEEQSKAFLSFFPALFQRESPPTAWIDYRLEHLDSALQHLGKTE